jgi:hypothetical protein
MPIGANANGNLNLILFEVGMIIREDPDAEPKVSAVGVHPLLVVPESIQYQDASRSPTSQTSGGAVQTVSGRALRNVNMSGTFGVDSRGLGPYIGTGEVRFQRFYKEVVRMPEALNKDQVDANKDIFRGTPLISIPLAKYDPENTVFYINFYDFWNEREFSAKISNWQDSRHATRGGASGLVHYSMTVEEQGELVTGSLVTLLIKALFNALGVWNAVNSAIETYSIDNILDAQGALGAVFLSQLNSSLLAVQGFLESATAVMGGFQPTSGSDGLAAFLTEAKQLGDLARELMTTPAVTNNADQVDNAPGEIQWSETEGEGGDPALLTQEELDKLEALADAAYYQLIAGSLYGMGPDEYQSFLAGEGEASRPPNVAGSIEYVVGPTDTEASIVQQFGLPWNTILDLNGMTPDEALFEGTTITIPTRRGRGSQSIDGLPVFGSHVGRDAWGADLTVEFDTLNGDIVVIDEEEVLQQGVEWTIEIFAEPLIDLLNQSPPLIRQQLLIKQLQRILLSDKRIAGIEDIQAELEGVAFDIGVTITAINGETVQTGGPQ